MTLPETRPRPAARRIEAVKRMEMQPHLHARHATAEEAASTASRERRGGSRGASA